MIALLRGVLLEKHPNQAIVEAGGVGYDVTIVDPRTAFASSERFPDVKVIADWPDAALPPLNIDLTCTLMNCVQRVISVRLCNQKPTYRSTATATSSSSA